MRPRWSKQRTKNQPSAKTLASKLYLPYPLRGVPLNHNSMILEVDAYETSGKPSLEYVLCVRIFCNWELPLGVLIVLAEIIKPQKCTFSDP